MKIVSVQSQSGGTGVTLTAAELALGAMAKGQAVLAVDTSPWRCLKEDIEEVGFHYLDDIRQLFRPLKEARWDLDAMPRHAILNYPEAEPYYLTRDSYPLARFEVRQRAAAEEAAPFNLRASIGFFQRHYDLMIVDVMNKDQRLMQMFHDVSDEVHLMLRDTRPHCRTIDDWRNYIEWPATGKGSPKIITHSDRKDVPGKRDQWGASLALKPYLDAAQNWRSTHQKESPEEVLQ